MEDLRSALLELQDLDEEIARAERKLKEFDPQLQSLDEPVTTLETEIATQRARLEEMRTDIRRLERAAEQKRTRLRTYEERLGRIRNAREDAAARTELDLIRRATEADETDALEKMEQARRTDLKVDEMEMHLEKLRADVAPKREALLHERAGADTEISVLRDRRKNHAVRLDAASLRLYERVRGGRSRTVLAPMTAEGACGNCFNILPIQEQSEVLQGKTLHRCEACGVILYPQSDGR
ncbi:MAG: zinc ribbon domain-containing protein [Longimicrobiales bacterium]